MAFIDSTTGSTDTDFPSCAVPAGAQADDIVVLQVTVDASGATFEAGDWPTGFTELGEQQLTGDGHRVGWAYKRLTGADSGSYTMGDVQNGFTGSSDTILQASLWRGRHLTNPPVIGTITADNNANASPVTVTAPGVTALDGDDLQMTSAPDVRAADVGNGHTGPGGIWTERQDAENNWSNLALYTAENVGAGATGNIAATFALTGNTAGWAACLIRIPAAAAAAGQPTIKRLGGVEYTHNAMNRGRVGVY